MRWFLKVRASGGEGWMKIIPRICYTIVYDSRIRWELYAMWCDVSAQAGSDS